MLSLSQWLSSAGTPTRGGRMPARGGRTPTRGGGMPARGGRTPTRGVPAEFNHCVYNIVDKRSWTVARQSLVVVCDISHVVTVCVCVGRFVTNEADTFAVKSSQRWWYKERSSWNSDVNIFIESSESLALNLLYTMQTAARAMRAPAAEIFCVSWPTLFPGRML